MPDTREAVSSEETSNRRVTRAGWGVLLIWVGTALLLQLGWGVGLIGAGVVVLAMQVIRKSMGLPWERFGIVAGLLLAVCGVWNLFDVSVRLLPVLCIAAGVALLLSNWAARKHPPAPGGHSDLPAASPPRA